VNPFERSLQQANGLITHREIGYTATVFHLLEPSTSPPAALQTTNVSRWQLSVPAAGTELAVRPKAKQGCCRAAQLRHNDAILTQTSKHCSDRVILSLLLPIVPVGQGSGRFLPADLVRVADAEATDYITVVVWLPTCHVV